MGIQMSRVGEVGRTGPEWLAGTTRRVRTVCLVDYSGIIREARSGTLLLLSV